MYEWLQKEIDAIRTNKFHRVDGPADARKRRAVAGWKNVPASYREFVVRFGSAELYRYDDLDLYYVTVYAAVRRTTAADGQRLYLLGRGDRHFAYFKEELLSGDKESPVFERIEPAGYLQRAADSFAGWLEDRCRRARKKYGKRRWAEIISGPPPFTDFEQQVVEARRRFRWRIVRITKSGDIEFEVHNGSAMVLPYLSIGIDDLDGILGGGGIFLPIGGIQPGQTKRIAWDCYKDFVPPQRIKAFELPQPGPEDRVYYWEFRATPRSARTKRPGRSGRPAKKAAKGKSR